ncbi:hypothetical protein UA08_02897 [Talaromyces atroroseus]|uniref:tRNA (uracil-O(2)-)-methyltransferase n=1 Tax=Talaromyces atroroseus TaxID=1441469 RepID=A0A225B4H5_TALAT|nr:hypothetical protein UA08_02897 [Talaromyces atroroseus]OKL61755.1 hypothetical protein UA08_02897 [Talaromyces atroroseus]
MARKPRSVRDLSKLSQKPLRETIIPSVNIILNNTGIDSGRNNEESLQNDSDQSSPPSSIDSEAFTGWVTSRDLVEKDLPFTQDVMYNLNNFLLGNPNMNSSQLFRADILFDSAGELKTPKEKEALQSGRASARGSCIDDDSTTANNIELEAAPHISGFALKRTVVRKLIPRNPNVDKPLNQTCHYYEGVGGSSLSHSADSEDANNTTVQRTLYVSLPHVKSVEEMPFYHPRLRGLAFLYDYQSGSSSAQGEHSKDHQVPDEEKNTPEQTSLSPGHGTLSVHFLPFPETEKFDPLENRLERILHNLLSTHIRLARNTHPTKTIGTGARSAPGSQHNGPTTTKKHEDDSYNPDKDNILPRHMVQNTYARLKMKYSRDLCQRWVESTEPSKHVFEDLLITAFLIELWRNMYGVAPRAERETAKSQEQGEGEGEHEILDKSLFPGFVDIACGNGVLVYVLLMEGYQGWGFDARQRKTWSIFPDWIQSNLKESLYIPKPFLAAVKEGNDNPLDQLTDHNGTTASIQYNTADFPQQTFVISNHADELTVWTPLLAALACPENPLPFLSIPCCSHSLSGARFRYPPPKKNSNSKSEKSTETSDNTAEEISSSSNNKTGDLKALRAEKQAASTSHSGTNPNSTAVLNSMYGSLTAKTMSIAEEIGYGVEKTMLRIPSTRNMGVIGGRIDVSRKWQGNIINYDNDQTLSTDSDNVLDRVNEVVERECAREGGVYAAAKIWIERAVKLQKKNS